MLSAWRQVRRAAFNSGSLSAAVAAARDASPDGMPPDLSRFGASGPRPTDRTSGLPLPRTSVPGEAAPEEAADPVSRTGHRLEWNVRKI